MVTGLVPVVGIPLQGLFRHLAKHARDARVRVLNVIDRVVVRIALGQLHVEVEVLIIRSHDIEKTGGVVANFLAQLP